MRVQNYQDIDLKEVEMEGATGCGVRQLVGQMDQAPNFAMRQFEVAPGGHTPKHFHDYEHEVFVLEGEGVVMDGDQEQPLSSGDVLYVAPTDVHQFRTTGDRPMRFLCLIPNSATGKQVTVAPECGLEST